ncbi:MAG: ABC transporter permease [Terracidiphilus sp.]
MSLMHRIANLFRRSDLQNEIDDELQAHLAMRIDDNIAKGMSPEEARRDAALRFGNRTSTRERVTAADAALSVESLNRDVRYGLRQLRRSPGFAVIAIVTLALCIGANVVVFSVVNALLLKPIDVPGSERLFQVVHHNAGDDSQSYPDFVDFRARNTAFLDMAVYKFAIAGISQGGTAERSCGYETSGNYFDMLQVQPEVGRLFHESDEHGPNSAPYVVLSDALWRTRFGANPNVVGATVEVNRHPFTVIGVAPRGFHGMETFLWPDFWTPIVNQKMIEGYSQLDQRSNHSSWMIGMLKPGVTATQATENLNAVARQMMRENPLWDDGLSARLVKPGLMGDVLGGPARPFLAAVMGLALLVLIAACVNLAGIFAARSADRARELAIRLSIGSTRWRILRQVATEAVLVSLAGGAAGTVVAALLLKALSEWAPIAEFPIHVTVAADWRVYAIAFGLSFLSGLLPGLLPARQIWRTDAMQAMKNGAPAGRVRQRLNAREVLLGVQIMLCALLVTASLVALRGMERSLRAPVGFVPQGALLVETDMRMAGYSDKEALALERRALEEALRIPGVTAAGSINGAPLSGNSSNQPLYRADETDVRPSKSITLAHYSTISPGYLQAAGTQLMAGRGFTWEDGPAAPKVAIVNETLAHKLFGDAPAVGRRFRDGGKDLFEIVGVAEDGKYDSLTEGPSAAVFYPLAQSPDAFMTLVVRSDAPVAETTTALATLMRGVDASLPFTIRTWPDAMALVLFPARAATAMLGVMGLLAALLAVTGVFGMAAYTVSKRLRELGIRVALGASRRQLTRAALGRPLLVLLCGSAAGLVLGVMGRPLLAYLVYQATPQDPLVLGGAVLTMVTIGLIATWIPARRALAVNPARLLREE